MSIVRPVPYNIQVGEYIDAGAITKNFIQLVEDINANALSAEGNPSQTFFVAPATDPSQAVNLGQANSLYAPAGNYAQLNGDSTQQFAVANATVSDQAVNLGQLGNYNQVIASFATGTLPPTCWGGAVQVQSGATATLPTANPPAGSKVVLFGFGGSFSVASNSNQYIYSPALGLTPHTGPTTVNVSDGGWIEITSRGNGEYDITAGSLLVFQSVAPAFTQPVSVPSAVSSGQAVNLGQVQTLISSSGGGGSNYNQVVAGFATGTLPSTCWGGAVQAASGAAITLPTTNPSAGSKIVLYGGSGGFSVVSNSNQYIYSPPIGLTSTTGPTTVNIPDGSWIELTSRGNGEYDITGGSPLVFQDAAPAFANPLVVPNAVAANQAVNLGQADARYQQRNLIVEAGAAGTLTSNAYIGVYVNAMQVNGSGVAVTLPANCSGSYAVATAAATAAQTINILKRAAGSTTLTTVGTITYAAGAASGTFSTTSGAAVTFNPGDAMYVQVGSTADTTLANVAISLFLTY